MGFLLAIFVLSARADVLLDIMNGVYNPTPTDTSCSCPSYQDDESAEPIHYSWDLTPIDPYENLEVIPDPYGYEITD